MFPELSQPTQRALSVALLSLALLAPASAAISPGGNATGSQIGYRGNGELFLMVADVVAQVSYTFDMGVTQDDFFVSGQPDAGVQRFWQVNDGRWTQFLAQADAQRLQWAVMAIDIFGPTAAGGLRWYTTAQQGDESRIASMTNQDLSTVLGRTTRYFTSVNFTGNQGVSGQALDFGVNGSSVNSKTDNTQYYGGDTLAPSMLNVPFGTGNAVGKSSWFYYLTRSGNNQIDKILVDEFDNLGHDGYIGFTQVDANEDSPYAGQYLLSYTLPPAFGSVAQRAFAASIGRTESTGGFSSSRLAGVAAASAETAALFSSRRLGAVAEADVLPQALGAAFSLQLGPATSPVPEPGAALLALSGLCLLAARGHRMARRCPSAGSGRFGPGLRGRA